MKNKKTKEQKPKWYQSHSNLELLARYLDVSASMSLLSFAEVLEKPWHWNEEYVQAKLWELREREARKEANEKPLHESLRFKDLSNAEYNELLGIMG